MTGLVKKKNSSIVLASSNTGKLRELKLLLSPLGFELKLQSELGVDDAEETGLTFVENAILKARHASTVTGLPALADDSGIEVDALQGQPGIYSARFAKMHGFGEGGDNKDRDNNSLLLQKLNGLPQTERGARFRCVLALFRHPDDPSPVIAEGSWEGYILDEPRGDNGYGYDPVFFSNNENCGVAELATEQKASASHRGQAMAILKSKLAGN